MGCGMQVINYDNAPSPFPSHFDWLSNFEPNLYLSKYPSNLVPVILSAYITYEDGTEYSETSAHKIQTPRNIQKKEYKIQNTAKV